MEKFKRTFVKDLSERLLQPVSYIQLVAGPRRIGKTTAVQQILASRHKQSSEFHMVDSPESAHEADVFGFSRFSAEAASTITPSGFNQKDAQWLVATWQRARQNASDWLLDVANNKSMPYILVFDEIHTIANWARIIKGLWDLDRANNVPMQVVLLGSAPLLIARGSNESLAGRFELTHATHWSYSEMQERFDLTLDEFIFYGGYPAPAKDGYIKQEFLQWRKHVLTTLIQPNIQKDILSLANIQKPPLLRQLFEMGCLYSGQILALNKVLGALQDAGNTTTLTAYLSLLSDAGLLKGLFSFSPNKIRQRASKPKFQVFNTAFQSVYHQLPLAQARADGSYWGRLVESAIGAHLINDGMYDADVSYWNDSDLEVDFVLQRGEQILAVEVKSGRKVGYLRGLDAFAKKYPQAKLLLVGGSDESLATALSTPVRDWFDVERF
jgi:uncharacterized protein